MQCFHIGFVDHDDLRLGCRVRRTYYAMVAETDFLMGQVLEAATARRDWDNTLVIFLSDHGEMNMEHRQV